MRNFPRKRLIVSSLFIKKKKKNAGRLKVKTLSRQLLITGVTIFVQGRVEVKLINCFLWRPFLKDPRQIFEDKRRHEAIGN